MPVIDARSMPCGYQTAREKKGLMPEAIACGHHASSQANILASPRPEPANRLAKWGSTGRPKSKNDASKYETKARSACRARLGAGAAEPGGSAAPDSGDGSGSDLAAIESIGFQRSVRRSIRVGAGRRKLRGRPDGG